MVKIKILKVKYSTGALLNVMVKNERKFVFKNTRKDIVFEAVNFYIFDSVGSAKYQVFPVYKHEISLVLIKIKWKYFGENFLFF